MMVLSLLFSFFPLVLVKVDKLVLMQKQMILTSEWCAEHLFTGGNTQQTSFMNGL